METTRTEPRYGRDGGLDVEAGPAPESRQRELAARVSDGLEVTLFWRPTTNELTVCVCDHRVGVYFEIRPEPHLALDAFYHPYLYASQSVVYFEDSRLAA
jgi:hypothetical protein